MILRNWNYDNFIFLVEDLGFKEWVKKRKHTESYQYKKDKRVIIEINKVEHLDYYLEIEYLAKRNEVKKAKKKIRQVLKELGIKQEQIDNNPLWQYNHSDRAYEERQKARELRHQEAVKRFRQKNETGRK